MLKPLHERIWGGYVRFDHMDAAFKQDLPPNFHMFEYYFKSGTAIRNAYAQQHHVSVSYTNMNQYTMMRGLNVVGNLLMKEEIDGKLMYNTSCSTDLFKDASLACREKSLKENRLQL